MLYQYVLHIMFFTRVYLWKELATLTSPNTTKNNAKIVYEKDYVEPEAFKENSTISLMSAMF